MESGGGKSGIVLAGGGARAAYQVGMLQALKEMLAGDTITEEARAAARALLDG